MKKGDMVNADNLVNVHPSQIQGHVNKIITTNPGKKVSTLTVVSTSSKPSNTLPTALPTVSTSISSWKQESKLTSTSQFMKDDMVNAVNLAKVHASQIQEHMRKIITTKTGHEVSSQIKVSSPTTKPATTLATALPTVNIGTSKLRKTTVSKISGTTSASLLPLDTRTSSATSK